MGTGVFYGSYIPTGIGSTARFKHLIDDLMTPQLFPFRQISIHDEPCAWQADHKSFATTFGNWLHAAPLRLRKNGAVISKIHFATIDWEHGLFTLDHIDQGADNKPRDEVEMDYWFDYFPPPVQEGLMLAALSQINMQGVGPPTYYTIETMPVNWEGILADLTFARCMQRLLLDYTLWRYRLVFAIGPSDIDSGGGGDIAGTVETLKNNAEQRADTAMQNEKFKTGNYLSPPTVYYFQSIRGLGGSMGVHGMPYTSGRLRGLKANRYI